MHGEVFGEDVLEGCRCDDLVEVGGWDDLVVLVAMADDVDGTIPGRRLGGLVGWDAIPVFEFWGVSGG